MPAGSTCTKPPVKVIEKITVAACIAIARKVQRSRQLSGDEAGAEAARLVVRYIQEDLLGASPQPPPERLQAGYRPRGPERRA